MSLPSNAQYSDNIFPSFTRARKASRKAWIRSMPRSVLNVDGRASNIVTFSV